MAGVVTVSARPRVACPSCSVEYAARNDGSPRGHGCDRVTPPAEIVIPLPWAGVPPLTKNMVRRLHYQREAQLRRAAIVEARWVIRAAMRRGDLKPMVGANITLHWRQPDNRGRDGDGAQPTLSLVIDALVLEGVLPDDSWIHVVHSGVTCHPPVRGLPGSLWVELTDPDRRAA